RSARIREFLGEREEGTSGPQPPNWGNNHDSSKTGCQLQARQGTQREVASGPYGTQTCLAANETGGLAAPARAQARAARCPFGSTAYSGYGNSIRLRSADKL